MHIKFAVISMLAALLVAGGASAQVGTLQNGRYHHLATGVEFNVPPGWSVVKGGASSDDGETVTLQDSTSKVKAAVWMRWRSTRRSTSRNC